MTLKAANKDPILQILANLEEVQKIPSPLAGGGGLGWGGSLP